jgi:hypothetical protein
MIEWLKTEKKKGLLDDGPRVVTKKIDKLVTWTIPDPAPDELYPLYACYVRVAIDGDLAAGVSIWLVDLCAREKGIRGKLKRDTAKLDVLLKLIGEKGGIDMARKGLQYTIGSGEEMEYERIKNDADLTKALAACQRGGSMQLVFDLVSC